MTLYSALIIAAVFGSGTFLLLQRDLTRIVVGIVLISNSAVLFIIVSGLTRGVAPTYPLPEGAVESGAIADPLVQAMALTAIIIGFALAALILAFVYRVFDSQGTMDLEEVAEAEMQDAVSLDESDDPEREEIPTEDQEPPEVEEDVESNNGSGGAVSEEGRGR